MYITPQKDIVKLEKKYGEDRNGAHSHSIPNPSHDHTNAM
jgi:hypothetical protein